MIRRSASAVISRSMPWRRRFISSSCRAAAYAFSGMPVSSSRTAREASPSRPAEGPQARADGSAYPLHAFADDDPVLLQEGNHVRHGGNGGQVQPLFQSRQSLERLAELQGDAGAAEEGTGIAAQQGIQDGIGFRKLFRQLMVVRDDNGEAEAFRQGDFRVIRDPAVHGDQEGRFRSDLPDGAFVQSVAVRLAAGKPEGDLRAFLRQGFQEDGCGADTVGVVVAENHDPFSGTDGAADQPDGGLHAFQEEGITQTGERGIQEPVRLFFGIDAPGAEQGAQPSGQGTEGGQAGRDTGNEFTVQHALSVQSMKSENETEGLHAYSPSVTRLLIRLWPWLCGSCAFPPGTPRHNR